MRSIQRRLSLGLISVMVIVGLVLAQTSLWLFEMGLQRYLEAGLRNDSENLLVALVRGPQGLQLDERHLSPAYQRPFSGHYFRIDFADSHWRSRSLWDQELPRARTSRPAQQPATGPGRAAVAGVALGLSTPGPVDFHQRGAGLHAGARELSAHAARSAWASVWRGCC